MDENKKTFNYTILYIVIYIILAIGIVIWIWWPKKETTANTVEKFNKVDANSKSTEYYTIKLKKLLSNSDTSELFEKLSYDYISNNNLTKDNYEKFLKDNGYISDRIEIISSNVNIQGDVYIYRFSYRSNLKYLYANLIETKPYEFTISFEQESIPIVNSSNNSRNSESSEITNSSVSKYSMIDGVKYEVIVKTIRDNGINYTLKITNNGENEVRYNFDNITNISVVLNDGKEAFLGGAVISSDDSNTLTPNGYLEKDLYFEVGSSDQNRIKYLRIRNVRVGDEKKTININM